MRQAQSQSFREIREGERMDTAAPAIEQIKASMSATWMAGDLGVVARIIAGAAEEFIARPPIAPGARVLDAATGIGNLALPLARAGAAVTGVDIATNLLEQARERAAAEGLSVHFDEGDAWVTMFGARFAPRPEVVTSELARVLKPGGLLAMANWNPTSFTGKVFRVSSQHVPPPPGITPPALWGDEAIVTGRLGPHFDGIRTEIIPVDFDLPTSPIGAFLGKYFWTGAKWPLTGSMKLARERWRRLLSPGGPQPTWPKTPPTGRSPRMNTRR
jgi:SAM-dependent methyltransferase